MNPALSQGVTSPRSLICDDHVTHPQLTKGHNMARTSICSRVYLDSDGNEFKNMPADPSKIVAQLFTFTNGEKRQVTPSAYSDAIRHGAMLHGFNQAYGDAFAGAKGDADDAVALFDARDNTLRTIEMWTSRTGTGGAKMDSILVEAVIATYADADIEREATVVPAYFLCEDFVGDEADLKTERTNRRKKWMKREDTAAHYATIKAERDAKKVTIEADSDEAVDMLDDI